MSFEAKSQSTKQFQEFGNLLDQTNLLDSTSLSYLYDCFQTNVLTGDTIEIYQQAVKEHIRPHVQAFADKRQSGFEPKILYHQIHQICLDRTVGFTKQAIIAFHLIWSLEMAVSSDAQTKQRCWQHGLQPFANYVKAECVHHPEYYEDFIHLVMLWLTQTKGCVDDCRYWVALLSNSPAQQDVLAVTLKSRFIPLSTHQQRCLWQALAKPILMAWTPSASENRAIDQIIHSLLDYPWDPAISPAIQTFLSTLYTKKILFFTGSQRRKIR